MVVPSFEEKRLGVDSDCNFFVGHLVCGISDHPKPFLVALSVVIMLGSLSSFFLPTRYELDDDKVKIRYLLSMRERKWGMFRSYYVDKNGVLLSPFERPSRLENFRGLYIRFDNNQDQVVDFVKSKIVKKHDGIRLTDAG